MIKAKIYHISLNFIRLDLLILSGGCYVRTYLSVLSTFILLRAGLILNFQLVL